MAFKFKIKDVKDNPNIQGQVLVAVDLMDGNTVLESKTLTIDSGTDMSASDIENVLKNKLNNLVAARTKTSQFQSLVGKEVL